MTGKVTILVPGALGLGQPGALPAGLVQPCPKPQALIHKPKCTDVHDPFMLIQRHFLCRGGLSRNFPQSHITSLHGKVMEFCRDNFVATLL